MWYFDVNYDDFGGVPKSKYSALLQDGNVLKWSHKINEVPKESLQAHTGIYLDVQDLQDGDIFSYRGAIPTNNCTIAIKTNDVSDRVIFQNVEAQAFLEIPLKLGGNKIEQK
jgi:hypothetical protein